MSNASSSSSHPYPADPIRVVHLRGSDRDIGRQHGELVGHAAAIGMPALYYSFWRRMLNHGPKGIAGVGFRVATALVDRVLVGRLLKAVPDFGKERMKGLSSATGRSAEELSTALVLPDLMPWLQAQLVRFRPEGFVSVRPPVFACSSFFHRGKRFLHGRNLDFPGVAYWDRYQVLQATFREGAIPFVAFTTAGVPLGGITGVNAEQISVSLHQHYCRESNLSGSLPFIIGEQILATARSLEQALAVLRDARISTAWAFLVSDGKKKEAFICERHPRAMGVRWLRREGEVLTHTNYFQSPECAPMEYATSVRMNWDNHARKSRLEELVRARGYGTAPADAAAFLSDHWDPHWDAEKILNRTVSQVYNIQSVVLDPERMLAWVAAGDCPIHLRHYEGFDLGAILSGGSGKTGESLAAYQFKSEELKQAKEEYILSFVSAFDGKLEQALGELRSLLGRTFFAEGAQVAAQLSMKFGDYRGAVELLESALSNLEALAKEKNKDLPPEYFECALYLARAYDLLDRRSSAVALYRRLAEHPELEDNNLRRIAVTAGPYGRTKLDRIVMPYSSYIPFE